MAKLAISVMVAWCATLSVAHAQEVSTEAACISTLRKMVSRLDTIENGLAGAAQACNSARDAAVAAAVASREAEMTQLRSLNAQMLSQAQTRERELADLKDAVSRLTGQVEPAKGALDAERKRTSELDQRVAGMRAEIDGLQRRNTEAAARASEAERQLRRISDQIDAAAGSRVREVLGGPLAGCETRPEVTAAGGVVTVTGRLMRADEARRRVAEAVSSVPGASARTEGLLKIDVCGQPLGNGWVVEGADDGLRRFGFNEIPSDAFVRMPDGSAETCLSIGASLDRISGPNASARSAFWVKRTGSNQLLAYCAPSSDGDAWAYNDTGLNQIRGVLVQRSQ
jgi:hypothetical protein